MSSRWQGLATIAAVATALTCSGGCTAPAAEQPSTAPHSTTSSRVAVSSPAETTPVISNYRASCADGRPNDPRRAADADDLVLGTVRFASALLNANEQGGLQPDGNYFFKSGAEINKGAATVTISIAPQMREEAAFLFEHADGYPQQVTVESCPTQDTWFVSGFILLKQRSACVPLDVAVLGKPKQRIVVSLGAGRCQRPE